MHCLPLQFHRIQVQVFWSQFSFLESDLLTITSFESLGVETIFIRFGDYLIEFFEIEAFMSFFDLDFINCHKVLGR